MSGPVATWMLSTGVNLIDRTRFLCLLIFSVVKSVLLKPFFFSFFVVYLSSHVLFPFLYISIYKQTTRIEACDYVDYVQKIM